MDNIENYAFVLTSRKFPKNLNLDKKDIFEIFDSEILANIPYLGDIVSTYKGIISLRDRIFTKKFLRFLQAYNNDTVNEYKLTSFRAKIETDKEYRTKVVETLVEFIDEIRNSNKIEIYSNLFAAYVNGNYNWEYFLDLSECLMKVNLNSLSIITKIDTIEGKEVRKYDEKKVSSESDLISSGLAIKMSVWSSDTYPTQFGKDLIKYGIK